MEFEIHEYSNDTTVIKQFARNPKYINARRYFEKKYPDWQSYNYEELKESIYEYFKVSEMGDRKLISDFVLQNLIYNPEGNDLDEV